MLTPAVSMNSGSSPMNNDKENTIIDSINKKVLNSHLPTREDVFLLAQENPILHNVLNLYWFSRNDCTWEEIIHLSLFHLIKRNKEMTDELISLRNKFGFTDYVNETLKLFYRLCQ